MAVVYKLVWAWRSCTSTFLHFLHLQDYETRKSKGSRVSQKSGETQFAAATSQHRSLGELLHSENKNGLYTVDQTQAEGWLCKRWKKNAIQTSVGTLPHLTPPGACNSNHIPVVQMIQMTCLGSRMPRTKQTLLFSKEGSGERLWNIFSEVLFS